MNVLLHGLLFMQANTTDGTNYFLEIVAPPISEHVLMAGTFENLVEMKTKNPDWRGIGLVGGTPVFEKPDVLIPVGLSPSILQFTRKNSGVGLLDGNRKRTITLPWPQTITPLRLGDIDTYFDAQHGTVADEIIQRCKTGNPKNVIGMVTCLQYQYDLPTLPEPNYFPVMNFHIYHQCCCLEVGKDHINQALGESQDLFHNKQNFNLKINSAPPLGVSPPGDNRVIGVSPYRDELSLQEDADYLDWISACPNGQPIRDALSKQAALRHLLCDGNSESTRVADGKQKKGSTKKGTASAKTKTSEQLKLAQLFNLSPANCPNFYIG
jgi:hypothetical protein